ncbi:fimbrial protein [Photorhabdus hainanensis]|uniref:fimbrial protein n=1 Tax=Photorhabdus hainanensis TaxID=1004166 RepID=UPI001BD388FD|nr:fimbrial protein [Photorhabdus hainanensis]MBS9432003.1 type 1 fimbrial protein [Photorhabdus hainanensis]
MKKILKISAVAALVMGAASAANAKNNAEVTITGMIVAATCDVTSPRANGNVDLGNHAAGTFAIGSGNLAALKSYSHDSQTKFEVGVTNCDAQNTKEKSVQLVVTGNTLHGSEIVFNKDQGVNAGAALSYVAADGKETLVKNGDTVPLSGGTEADHFNNSKVEFTAYLAAKSLPPAQVRVDAPITFSYAYN